MTTQTNGSLISPKTIRYACGENDGLTVGPTGWSKKEDITLQMVTLSIVGRFSIFFTVRKLTKFAVRYL